MTQRNARRDCKLTCWYLNLRRAGKLIDVDRLAPELQALSSISDAKGLQRAAVSTFFERHLEEWLAATNPPSLESR